MALPAEQSDQLEAGKPASDGVPLGQASGIRDSLAQYPGNRRAAPPVERRPTDTTRGREPTGADRLVPIARLFGVLKQAVGKRTDCAGTQADQDVGGVIGEALEIAA
ncbi:hypothetical protein [Sphingomonas phyllosphaerae]|uniref:hypothetical protein n=1 Tax=Sphingomonas phyllosphaerae TaxID=257003 RepID=UPI0012DE2FB6|nr:hypothetical protein [Sphingomonas phyllosphaerae]